MSERNDRQISVNIRIMEMVVERQTELAAILGFKPTLGQTIEHLCKLERK